MQNTSEEEALRARFYALLAHLLSGPPDPETLERLSTLKGDDSDMGHVLATLAAAAQRSTAEDADDEYHRLFIGLTGGEVTPYACFYLTGHLFERPLADLRRAMERFGIVRAAHVAEPEDHIASLCEIMHGLIQGRFAAPADLASQRSFFETFLGSWATRFFIDLEDAPSARLYRPVATLGRVFMDIERRAFAMTGDRAVSMADG